MLTKNDLVKAERLIRVAQGYAEVNEQLGAYTEAFNGYEVSALLQKFLEYVKKDIDPICKECGKDMSSMNPGERHRTTGCEAGRYWTNIKKFS